MLVPSGTSYGEITRGGDWEFIIVTSGGIIKCQKLLPLDFFGAIV